MPSSRVRPWAGCVHLMSVPRRHSGGQQSSRGEGRKTAEQAAALPAPTAERERRSTRRRESSSLAAAQVSGKARWLPVRLARAVPVLIAGPIAAAHFFMALVLVWFVEPAPALIVVAVSAVLWVAGSIKLGLWVARLGRRRLRDVAQALGRIQQGEFDERLAEGYVTEVDQISAHINVLMQAAADQERRFIRKTLSDPLTKLPNRTLLTDRIELALADARRDDGHFAVLMLDLDRFKLVNDMLGHHVGDTLLKKVARRLCDNVRKGDTVARLGGDEFVLLLRSGPEDAMETARRVQSALRIPVKHGDELIDLGASIGVAFYPDHGADVDTLMKHADLAMYEAKRQRLGTKVFDGNTAESHRSHLSLLGEMRQGLRKRQFQLDFQPKQDVRSGVIVGVEGLVRWQHPTRGRVHPAEFIPFAEQTGFMRELTRWVVDEGARFSTMMLNRGIRLKVSVNVTAQDIQDPQFSTVIREIVLAHAVDTKLLCLEITESDVVTDARSAMRNLEEISALGISLSVDDFGTGYSNLTQLQKLPVSELKIDRSFVSNIDENPGNQSIVRATIDMAKQLQLSVVAEGVETINEMRMLANFGCDLIQGFHVGKPMTAARFTEWLALMKVDKVGSAPIAPPRPSADGESGARRRTITV